MNYKILSLVILSGICGGSVYPLIKFAETYGIPPISYIFWESLLVVIVFAFISILQKEKELFRKSEWRYYLFCALTNIIIPQVLFFIIAPHLDTSIMGLIVILTPLFIYLTLLLLKNIKFCIIQLMGIIIGFCGAGMLFLPKLWDVEGETIGLFWLAFAFLLPLDYTINRIFVSKFQPDSAPSYRLAIGLFGTVCALCFIGMFVFGQAHNPFNFFNLGHLALTGHALLMVGFYSMFFALARHGALQNSLASYVIPAVALAWGVLLFEETPQMIYALSAILILSGLYLTGREKRHEI